MDSQYSEIKNQGQASHITNLSPFFNPYEDEQNVAHLLNQRFTLNPSGTLGKPVTITQPTINYDFPLLNEKGITVNQIRRSELSKPYEYKPSAQTKQIPCATSYPTSLTMSGYHDETQGTPFHVHRKHQQQSKGNKQTAKIVSRININTDYTDLDESAVQLDQMYRSRVPQVIQYKMLSTNQPSSSITRQMPSVFSHEDAAQEAAININQLRQPPVPQSIQYKIPIGIQPSTVSFRKINSVLTHQESDKETPIKIIQVRHPIPKRLPTISRIRQQARSITQPTLLPDFPGLDDTSVYLNQIYRSEIPQSIRYKAAANVQPSNVTIIKKAFALTEQLSPEHVCMHIAQLRQPIPQNIFAFDPLKQQVSSVVQPSITFDSSGFDESSIQLDRIRRLNKPEIIQYRLPVNIQPSTGSIVRNTSTLSNEDLFGETSLFLNKIQQRLAQVQKNHGTFV